MKLEIFKVGKHTSSSGVTKDYTLDHLYQIIHNHSEPTPIVVGHPKDNSPAFGWIKNLFLRGESLFAEASDIVPEFLDLLKQKIYKNRSVSLKQNEDGTLSLNHVGFLGGTLPAVKGLQELNLSTDQSESFELALSEAEMMEFSDSELSEKLTADGTSQVKKDDEVIPKKEDIDFAIELLNMKTVVQKLTSDFHEALQTLKGTIDSKENLSAYGEMQTKIDELNIKLDAAYYQRSIQEKLDFSSLTPAIKTKLEKLLGYFESLDFSEDENSQIFSDFQELADLIEPFQTDEVLKKVEFQQKSKDSINEFSAMETDKDSLKIYNEACKLAEQEEISFSESVNRIILNKKSEA